MNRQEGKETLFDHSNWSSEVGTVELMARICFGLANLLLTAFIISPNLPPTSLSGVLILLLILCLFFLGLAFLQLS